MKNKIVGLFICTLLIVTTISPVMGIGDTPEDVMKLSVPELTEKKTFTSKQFNLLDIDIIKPDNAFYYNDKELFSFFMPLIIGPITIEAEVTGDIAERVEFYINDELKNTDYTEPYTWFWDETTFFLHKIKVVAYDDTGNTGEEELSVLIFNAGTPTEITKDEAIEILMSKIMRPSSSTKRISAFMLLQPLQKNDVVSSESGSESTIKSNTWFVFIDDNPSALYAHGTRYAFIDAKTAAYDIFDEMWSPLINNVSMWDTKNLSRGYLIEIYPIWNSSVPILGSVGAAPRCDYGDAPDDQDAYIGIVGKFPTLYNTSNSMFGRDGGHCLITGQEMLGCDVSEETDANDLNDPDGVPNLVDSDKDDRTFVILDNNSARLCFDVTVNSTAPECVRYINALIDFDQNGMWTEGINGVEWVLVNMPVNVSPGTTETIISDLFSWGIITPLSSPVWMRLAITREKVNESMFSSCGGWDGSGEFEYGEIEDYLGYLTDVSPATWPPMPGSPPWGDNGDGNGKIPVPPTGPCGTPINYYSIIIDGGDHKNDIRRGFHMVRNGAQSTYQFCKDHNYTSIAYLSSTPTTANPDVTGLNNQTNIKEAFKKINETVKCVDRVLVFIFAHGCDPEYCNKCPKDWPQEGGFGLHNSNGNLKKDKNGKVNESSVITPSELKSYLEFIRACPDKDCTLPNFCCHVTVLIESCYSGSFTSIAGVGRCVIGTSNHQCSWGNSKGGVYSQAWFDALDDLTCDKEDKDGKKDGYVNESEAHAKANKTIQDRNRRRGRDQAPWINCLPCLCVCPCKPSIDVEKWAWDEIHGEWADEIDVFVGQNVWFLCQIINDGECRNVTDILMVDWLPYCLSYANDATIYRNGEEIGPREPDGIGEEPDALRLVWDLEEMGELAPEESITIMFSAIAEYPGENINLVNGSARCTYDYNVVVSDEATATVNVISE